MKKCLFILIVLLVCLCPLSVYAAESSIQIELPEGMEGTYVQYGMQDDNMKSVVTDEENMVRISGLKDGTYKIVIPKTGEYQFEPIEIDVPLQDEDGKKKYDIIIHPKYSRNIATPEIPETGDDSKTAVYAGIGIISLIIVVIISCHNRFKCDRMTGKYSKNGGYSNGNDNDTKNPRRTRRIRFSCRRAID